MSIGDTDFGVQVGFGFAGRVVMALVAFAGSVVLARLLGPSGYGAFYLLMAVVAVLDNPVTGWANACRKRLTEVDFPPGEAVGAAFLGVAVCSAIVVAASALLAPVLAAFSGDPHTWFYLAVLFVGVATFQVALDLLLATADFGAGSWMQALRDSFRVVGQAFLVLAGYGVGGMVGGIVAANVVLVPFVLTIVGVEPTLPSRSTLRDIWSFARSSIPRGILSSALSRLDLLILGGLVGTTAVGHYEVARKLTMPAMFVAGVATSGLMGRISNRRSKQQDVASDVENTLAYASVLSVPLFFGALVVAEPVVVTIYEPQFRDASALLVGLALFQVVRSQRTILSSTLDGFDRPDLNLYASVGVFVLNVTLGVSLLYLVGPLGVVVATVVSESVSYLVRSYLVRSLVPSLTLWPRPLLEQVMSGAIMALAVITLRRALPLDSTGRVLFAVAVGVVIYFAALVLVSSSFRLTVASVVDGATDSRGGKA